MEKYLKTFIIFKGHDKLSKQIYESRSHSAARIYPLSIYGKDKNCFSSNSSLPKIELLVQMKKNKLYLVILRICQGYHHHRDSRRMGTVIFRTILEGGDLVAAALGVKPTPNLKVLV